MTPTTTTRPRRDPIWPSPEPRAALLAALHDDPADGAAWLALADCLEEEGDADRADLVRLRFRLGSCLMPAGDREADEARLVALLNAGVQPCGPRLVTSTGLELALLPAATFRMGAPAGEAQRDRDEDPHEVELTRPFFLSVTTVTQVQFEQVCGRNPSHFQTVGAGKDSVAGLDTAGFPVDSVTWDDAIEFCDRLSAYPAERLAGRSYRLPTEAEWEYACRAGTTTPFHFGAGLSWQQANVAGEGIPGSRRLTVNSCLNDLLDQGRIAPGSNLGRTCAVGRFPPNAFGLHDMHGNVWEWCADWFSRDAYHTGPRRDPTGPLTGTGRVLRGGSYNFAAWLARSACRVCYPPLHRAAHDGFRVALTWQG